MISYLVPLTLSNTLAILILYTLTFPPFTISLVTLELMPAMFELPIPCQY